MNPIEQTPEREIEADWNDSNDSALGDSQSAYTQSIRSEFLDSLRENGRSYHRYRDGQYYFPDDEQEQERLDLQHAIFLRSFNDRLFLAPVSEPIKEVLDLGTGTGIWAIDFADENPEADVLGMDLSPIQPTFLPPNCRFEMDDFDAEWLYKQQFDLIHGRMLITTSDDYPRLFKQAFDNLRPGGWLEMQDVILPFGCDDETIKGTAIEEWEHKFTQACSQHNRDPLMASRYKDLLIEVGFQNVEERDFKWPINPWPKDPELKTIGRWNEVNFLEGLEGFCARLFSSTLGMSQEEIQVFLAQVRKDISNRSIHTYWKMYTVYGQKPLL